MAYAADIIKDSLERTKELFFPIRLGYWFRMGFIGMFSTFSRGGSTGNSSSFNRNDYKGMNFKDAIANFNSEALQFLTQYGSIVGIVSFFMFLFGLLFSYINSVFIFMFLDGVLSKDIRIRKGFKNNKKMGVSLFSLRFIVGIFSFIFSLIIFSPLAYSFFTNNLSTFNYWLLIPMFLVIILVSIILGFFWFFVMDFIVPIMYMKKLAFFEAWNIFKKIVIKNKMEIFMYWLIKLGLQMAIGLISLFLLIPIFLILAIVAIPFVLVGIGLYFGLKILGEIPTIVVLVGYALTVFFLLIYLMVVIFVPISAFFRIYSVEMLKKLEKINP